MERKEHSVGENYAQSAHCHAVIAVACPVAIETKAGDTANEGANNRQCIREEWSVWLQPIVAADFVVVAERGQDRCIREGSGKLHSDKLHRLPDEQAIGSVRVIRGRSIKFTAKIVRKEIAG